MYTDIKTFEDACKVLNLTPETVVPDLPGTPEQFKKSIIAYVKLLIIVAAVNDGWMPDYQNMDQRKYEPWFDLEVEPANPTGFRLLRVDGYVAGSGAGSRLCFETREKADYTITQFIDLYKDFIKP